jgi:hypothetical protein
VAKLAQLKRFNEWCPCIYNTLCDDFLSNSEKYDWDFHFELGDTYVAIPAHYQLIKWLKDKHNIDVQMQHNGLWDIQDNEGDYADLGLEINEALTVALNLIEP